MLEQARIGRVVRGPDDVDVRLAEVEHVVRRTLRGDGARRCDAGVVTVDAEHADRRAVDQQLVADDLDAPEPDRAAGRRCRPSPPEAQFEVECEARGLRGPGSGLTSGTSSTRWGSPWHATTLAKLDRSDDARRASDNDEFERVRPWSPARRLITCELRGRACRRRLGSQSGASSAWPRWTFGTRNRNASRQMPEQRDVGVPAHVVEHRVRACTR